RRLGRVAAMAAKQLADVPALPVRGDALLGLAERLRVIEVVGGITNRVGRIVVTRRDLGPQRGILHENRPLHRVAELADVAGPVEAREVIDELAWRRRAGADERLVELRDEERDVVAALAQRWDLEA